jgi:hypothetical protein
VATCRSACCWSRRYRGAAGNLAGFAIGRYGGRRILERICAADRLHKMEASSSAAARGGAASGASSTGCASWPGSSPAARHGLLHLLLLEPDRRDPWVGFWAVGAFLFERDFEEIAHVFHHFRPYALGFGLVVLVLALLWMRRGAAKPADAAPDAKG